MDFPFKAEYAKSGRASCKGCKGTIAKDSLRIATMVQSPMFDGKMAKWFHSDCFFEKQKPKSSDEIEHFENLRYEDQQTIKNKIEDPVTAVLPSTGKGKGKKRNVDNSGALKAFNVEYSKSSRAGCRGCEQKIMKGQVRISKKDFESDVGKTYGGQDRWHHVDCFAQLRSELLFFECGDKLPGFNTLKKEDKDLVKKQIPAIKQEDIPETKKIKTEVTEEDKKFEKDLKVQTDILFKYRDQLKSCLSKAEMYNLLKENGQDVPTGEEEALNRLSDIMTFGALERCKECSGGQFVFNKCGYVCQGNKTEWTKCNVIVKEPKRVSFKIPQDFLEKDDFFKEYKYVPRVRIFKDVSLEAQSSVKKEEIKRKVEHALPVLSGMKFLILKCESKSDLKGKIKRHGGLVDTYLTSETLACISTKEQVKNNGKRIQEAKSCAVHVITEDFIDEVEKYRGDIASLIIKKSICDWGSDPETRMPQQPGALIYKPNSSGKSMYTKSGPSTLQVIVKDGTAVDPDAGFSYCDKVYINGINKYTVTLGLTDIQSKKNSYYKIQLLHSGIFPGTYRLFRAWGRIGTTIGNTQAARFHDLDEAIKQFHDIYFDKTGNKFENRDKFVKIPGKMYPVDVDYTKDDEKLAIDDSLPSKLPKPVQYLVKLIFNIDNMREVMNSFQLDLEKMPLGKLSKTQLRNAFTVLTELQTLVTNKASQHEFIDACNRFYTLIPHSFGVEDPPIINTEEDIKKKVEMVENLMELEIAKNLLSGGTIDRGVDSRYDALKTDIEPLDRSSEEFRIIEEYVRNTHAATHSYYQLEIGEAFRVNRHGESDRFESFKHLPNRKLLWHGSRLTNFAGILSQGLRIAPPEAPCTGYMFGKGIYFADRVSKSANYCCSDPSLPVGLMLLCDVALGEWIERKQGDYITSLPKGKYSCKGLGSTQPDPAGSKTLDGIEVPAGKDFLDPNSGRCTLLYNEYIVYDVGQVNVKYMLQMNFKYNY